MSSGHGLDVAAVRRELASDVRIGIGKRVQQPLHAAKIAPVARRILQAVREAGIDPRVVDAGGFAQARVRRGGAGAHVTAPAA